jgi:hypothetical protein
MDTKKVGHAALVGWREKVADRVAPRLAARTRFDEDAVRAVLGLAFLALTLRSLSRMVRNLRAS